MKNRKSQRLVIPLILSFLVGLVAPVAAELSIKEMLAPERLEPFQLISKVEQDEPEPEPEPALDPTWTWRILGYVQDLTCGVGIGAAADYREFRSRRTAQPWTSDVNTLANYPMWLAASRASNMTSETIRKRSKEDDSYTAFIVRAGTIAACGYLAGKDFRAGRGRR